MDHALADGDSTELCARLTGRLAPDFKTIADFRRDNGPAIRKVCQQFVALCRDLHLLDANIVAIDGSKFKAVNAKRRTSRARTEWRIGEPSRAPSTAISRSSTARTKA